MLLYALRNEFFERRARRPAPNTPSHADAGAMIAASAFVAFWCCLRLWAAHQAGFGIDHAIAIACLFIGLWGVQCGIDTLPVRGSKSQL